MSKHTPHPWVMDHEYITGQCRVAIICRSHGNGEPVAWPGDPDPEAEANARLIVAAPDLLEALRACSTWMKEHGCVPPCLQDAFRAIARATEEPNGHSREGGGEYKDQMRTWDLDDIDRRSEADLDPDHKCDDSDDDDDWRDENDPAEDEDR